MNRVSAIVLTLLTSASLLLSQEARGRILGRITDASGAVIPNVSVEITNVANGRAIKVESNKTGIYHAPFLIPGIYRLRAARPGFKGVVRDGLEVRVDDRLEVNVVLEVGDVADTVRVVAEAPLLATANASLGLVVDARRVAELPLPHGVPFHLIRLAPGVTFAGGHGRFDQPYAPTPLNWYAMDGTRAGRSDLTLDGAPISAAASGAGLLTGSYVPPADIVAEFKVQTAVIDASVGQTEGGLTNISLKSGTNTPHGTVYDNKKDASFDANNFFANRAGQPRADFTYNRWGASASGPVRLPKLYNGSNRTFYMYGYEGIKTLEPRGTTLTVPTAKQREGDFSDLLRLGGVYQIYDPATRMGAAGGRFQSAPLPGNIIPASRISPIAKSILSYYPLPTAAGTADGRNNLPLINDKEDLTYYTHTARFDHNLSDRHRIFARVSVYKRDSFYNDWFKNIATGESFQFLSRSAAFDDVYTFSPTFFMNVRYGYNRFVTAADTRSQGFDLTTLGFPRSYNDAIPPAIRRFPHIDPEGYYATSNLGLWQPMDTHSAGSSLERIHGSHNAKFGVEYRAYRRNLRQFSNSLATGRLSFRSTYTRGPFDNSPAAPIGQGLASMMLGIVSGGSVNRLASYAQQSTAWSLYYHDDWKLTRKLTVSLGLRYELEGPLTERFDRSVRGFDYSFIQPLEAQVRANYATNATPEVSPQQFLLRGGLTFAGVGGQPRTLWERDKNNFMPRIGFAYNVFPKTVLRAGYGIYFGFLGVRRTDVNQSGFSQDTPIIPSLDGGLTFNATLANPFPAGIQEPAGSTAGPLTFLGRGISFFNRQPLAPYMQRWQFSVQHELPHRILTEVSYVGNRGTKIETFRNLKAIPNQYLSTLPVRDQARIDYLSTNLQNPFNPLLPGTGLSGTLASRDYLLSPLPHFTGVSSTTNEGYSWYHSLQASVEKRFSHGYTLQAAYTWAKFMEAVDFLNGADPRPVELIADQDIAHRIVVSGIYELPFGRGRRFLSASPKAVDAVLGGWQVSAVFNGQSGRPLFFGNIFFHGNVKNITLPRSQRSAERWFNTAAGFERDRGDSPALTYARSRSGSPTSAVTG